MKVALHLTHDCNLRCIYCYAGKKYDRHMSRETAEAAVRFAHANSTKAVDISFFGGEPLLEKEILWHTVAYAREWRSSTGNALPLRFFVTTNGLLLDEPFLEKARETGLEVSLSLDGHGRGHDLTRTLPDGRGSFATLAALFPLILRSVPQIQILVTFTPVNLPFLAEGVEKLYFSGFRRFVIGANYEETWTGPDLDLLADQYRKLAGLYESRLRAGEPLQISLFDPKIAAHTGRIPEICSCCDKNDGEIAVAPSGNLYPCLRFVKGDEDHSLLIGTLAAGIDLKARARIMAAAGRENPACASCGYKGRCFHYCSAVNFKVTGRFDQAPAVLCRQEQIAIDLADEVAGRLYADRVPVFMRRFYG